MSQNELAIEHLSINSMNFASKYNSPSRAVMFSNHLSQRLVISGSDEKRIQTGMEKEMSKYTFSIKMPENGRILKVIERYPAGISKDSLNFNPETVIIYEIDETKEIDYFSIVNYASYHQSFGFEYQFKDAVNSLKAGSFIAKDTIFADSSSVGENGSWNYGVGLNMAFMSLPSVSEDGIVISRSALQKLKFKLYETRVVEFGSSTFPLNLFGTHDNYRPFKDIGEFLNDDGVLMLLRSYEEDLSPVDMSIYDTMECDYIFDKATYVRGGKGKVVDIKVISNNSKNKQLPDKMCEQVNKYCKALLKFHRDIVDAEQAIRYERKRKYGNTNVKLTPKFHRLLVESLVVLNHNHANMKQDLNLIYRKNPIDEYRAEFVVEYEITPGIGFKLTDQNGGKGVICKIEEDENMPIDSDGNRAEIVMDAASTIARMNLGRLHEHYLTAAARDVSKAVRKMLGFSSDATVDKLYTLPENLVLNTYQHLLGFYEIISELQYEFFRHMTGEDILEHLCDVINDGVYIYYPISNPKDGIEIIRQLEQRYRPTYGPVSYVGNSGHRSMTRSNVRIAPLYMMLLEKIADDWSSISSGKLQHFGVLAPMTKSEKFSYPYRNTPIRTIGETEGRIFAGYCGREAIAEMIDRSNNPVTQRNIVYNILAADKPTNIDEVVDRNYIPLGGHRPLQLVRHIMGVAGVKLVYEPEDVV